MKGHGAPVYLMEGALGPALTESALHCNLAALQQLDHCNAIVIQISIQG